MTEKEILEILKMDLQISAAQYESYLLRLISRAKDAITEEGIVLKDDSIADGMLVETYAAYLYRKRKGENTAMPRSLRYALNNRLFSQKGSA